MGFQLGKKVGLKGIKNFLPQCLAPSLQLRYCRSAVTISGRVPLAIRKPRSFSTSEELWSKVQQEAAETGSNQSTIINRALADFFQTRTVRSSWSLEDDDWYDEHRFYTFTEDKNGHSAKITMNVPKNLAGTIHKLVGNPKIPELKSPQDFYRSALFHYAHKVGRWIDDEELVEQVTLGMMQADLDAIVQGKRDVDALIESARAAFDLALGDENMLPWAEAKLRELWAQITSVPEMFKRDLIECLVEYGNKFKAVKEGHATPILRANDR